MAFWSTQRVKAEQQQLGNLIAPFDPLRVKQGAYELSLSREVVTAPPKGALRDGTGKALEISAGQFAILYTEERVTIPAAVIAFISIKASVKFDGLVNISGFHVDPGFSGRLKFSVYNAGTASIFLDYNRVAFPIWFSDLDQATEDPYDGNHKNQDRITPADRRRLSRASYSPSALNERLRKVERKITAFIWIAALVATGIAAPIAKDWIQERMKKPSSAGQGQATPTPASALSSPLASPAPAATVTPAVQPPAVTPTLSPATPHP